MREFGLILFAGLVSAVLGAGFGWLVGEFAPEFIILLAKPHAVQAPQRLAAALGAIAGLGIGTAAMIAGMLVVALRNRNPDRR